MGRYDIIQGVELILYDSRSPKPKKLAYPLVRKLFRQVGLNLLFLAVVGVLFVVSPVIVPEITVGLKPKAELLPVQITFNQVVQKQEEFSRELASKEAQKYGVTTDFSLVIPKISAASKIIPNVNPSNEEEYRLALKSGVAHSAGTSLPGEKGTVYLFAHSTNSLANVSHYNAIFYQLKDLIVGDKIIIFYTGQMYVYQVTENFTTKADDTTWLTNPPAGGGEKRLVLQTCWPPGTTWKRLIVVAKPV